MSLPSASLTLVAPEVANDIVIPTEVRNAELIGHQLQVIIQILSGAPRRGTAYRSVAGVT